ncbi:MAG: TIM barrel protein [Boseongicola sp.]
MLPMAVNHMAVPNMRFNAVLSLSADLGCVGVEFRNDLGASLFDGEPASAAKTAAAESGQRILALAEIKAFNELTIDRLPEVKGLISTAQSCGAEGVSLIPRNGGKRRENSDARARLRDALTILKPLLEEANLLGFVEPLGFESSSLRRKSEALEAIDSVGGTETFRLIHDTFHHCLSGETELFPNETAIVHVSGVADSSLSYAEMRDEHRGLVDGFDQLGNVAQLRPLLSRGFEGPISFEPFAPEIHALDDPGAAIAASIGYLRTELAAIAA